MARIQQMAAARGNRILLGMAVAAGAVAALLAFVALSQGNSSGGTVSGGATKSVVVAAQDINAGTVITSDMVKLQAMPESQIVGGSATDSSAVVGQEARVKIFSGEQVPLGRVGAENKTEGASGVVPPGMRGISIGVEEVRAVGGLLRPGNRVDVWLSAKHENDPSTTADDTSVSHLILQDIEVLSVAQVAQEPAAQPSTQNGGEAPTTGQLPDNVKQQPGANTVTLLVTPDQAAMMICAQEGNGSSNRGAQDLWLALRGFGEPHSTQTTVLNPCDKPL